MSFFCFCRAYLFNCRSLYDVLLCRSIVRGGFDRFRAAEGLDRACEGGVRGILVEYRDAVVQVSVARTLLGVRGDFSNFRFRRVLHS